MKRVLLLLSLLASVNSFAQTQAREAILHTYTNPEPYQTVKVQQPKGKHPKNVIIMIGDGMSLMHVYTAWTVNHGALNLENCPYTGLSKTYCANKLITDSAAGGSAIATGQKLNYHHVAVDAEGNPLQTVFDDAKAMGKSTGIVTTCRIWDATPADFCCHNTDREDSEDIAADYLESDVDYIFGGGYQYFVEREDGRDIKAEMRAKGYQTPDNWEEVMAIQSGKVLANYYRRDTPRPDERGDLLARATIKGMDLLKKNNKKGFFMMIEGSQLDDYGHSNNLELLMKETLDFDRTIGEVLKWAEKDGQTLVIITADHETGGLTLVGGDKDKGEVQCKFSTDEHSGVMVPVYAYGPGAENFTGIFENSDIRAKIQKIVK